MIALILFTALIWILAALAGRAAMRRGDDAFGQGLQEAWRDLKALAPRVLLGVLSAGFLARLAPTAFIEQTLGAGSGMLGLALASFLGALVPGGPVLAYTLAGAAIGAGAGQAQVLSFVTAWLLYSVHRSLVWEAPVMGAAFLRRRVALSLPVPLLVGLAALALFD